MYQETPLQRTGRMALSGLLLYFIFKKLIKDLDKSKAEEQADTNPAVRQAMILNSAMNPSGLSWMRSMDTTNVESVEAVANQIQSLDEVVKAYKSLYNRDLLMDLEKELTAADYNRILSIITSKAGADGKPMSPYVTVRSLVAVKKAVYLRRTPDASYHEAWYEPKTENNIVRLASPGEFIGFATGNQQYDAKNNVKFIQVGYAIEAKNAPDWAKSRNKAKVMYWVSASNDYIDTFPYYKNLFDKYPGTKKDTVWKRPLDYFESAPLKGWSGDLLISLSPVLVLDEQLKPIGTASDGMILGRLIMRMQTDTNQLVQFETTEGKLRWTDAKRVRIQRT